MRVTIRPVPGALGNNILWGNSPEKLYHSLTVFSAGDKRVGALAEGRNCFVRVDSFSEWGITEGTRKKFLGA